MVGRTDTWKIDVIVKTNFCNTGAVLIIAMWFEKMTCWLQCDHVHCAIVGVYLTVLQWYAGHCSYVMGLSSCVDLPAAMLLLGLMKTYMIIIGGKDLGHSCMIPFWFGCFASTSKCGANPTQWLSVTTSSCLSNTVKITPIMLSLHWE